MKSKLLKLILPDFYFENILQIKIELLHELGIKAVLLDVDNTLAFNGAKEPFEGVLAWLEHLKKAKITAMIISNNIHSRIEPFANELGISHISLAKKPLPSGFLKAKQELNLKSYQIAVIGDQIFTDILGAKLAKMPCFLLDPFTIHDEPRSIRFRRILEKPIRRRLLINQR